MKLPSIQCLTADGLALSHAEQVRAFCQAGAKMIQLRMKQADAQEVVRVVRDCLPACRQADCLLIVNDHLEAALESGADGVHLGKNDLPWEAAREQSSSGFLIGGTVNSLVDAKRASACAVLDYAGVGPYRFTHTKACLADVLKREDWQSIVHELGVLPSFAIGGIGLGDLASVSALGVHGVAVCSSVVCDEPTLLIKNYRSLATGWETEKGLNRCQV
ncbi:MAG: thiamine phosphate synthase [Coraliomargaritaceae bacterium]